MMKSEAPPLFQPSRQARPKVHHVSITAPASQEVDVTQFWAQDEIADKRHDLSLNDLYYEEHFTRTHTRNEDGT